MIFGNFTQAPIHPHTPPKTDFLVIIPSRRERTRERERRGASSSTFSFPDFFVREIDRYYTVGQEFPFKTIPGSVYLKKIFFYECSLDASFP
jgi:hypothetical protein